MIKPGDLFWYVRLAGTPIHKCRPVNAVKIGTGELVWIKDLK